MSEKRKSISPQKRAGVGPAPRLSASSTTKAAAATTPDDANLRARIAHAEEELGQMLVRASRAEERARAAEAKVQDKLQLSSDERLHAALAECELLKETMREAATMLLRALRPGPRAAPPPLPPLPTIDISEIAEMVESLRPPPHRP